MAKLNVCCDVALYTKCAGVMVGVNKVTCTWDDGVGCSLVLAPPYVPDEVQYAGNWWSP